MLSVIHNLARYKISKAQLRKKITYDVRAFQRSYDVGDVVAMISKCRNQKENPTPKTEVGNNYICKLTIWVLILRKHIVSRVR